MSDSKSILVANGVNLDLLGKRDSNLYGKFDLKQLEAFLEGEGLKVAGLFGLKKIDFTFFQSNHEAQFLDALSAKAYDGALINPAAWTHTSLALGDRLEALKLPFIEVHISHLGKREAMRQKSFSAPHALGVVYGLGMHSYSTALMGLLYKLTEVKFESL